MTEMYFNIFHKVLSFENGGITQIIGRRKGGYYLFFVFLEGKIVIKENLSPFGFLFLYLCVYFGEDECNVRRCQFIAIHCMVDWFM